MRRVAGSRIRLAVTVSSGVIVQAMYQVPLRNFVAMLALAERHQCIPFVTSDVVLVRYLPMKLHPIRRTPSEFGSCVSGDVIMSDMADKGGRTARERITTLAQAALNADLTVEQVGTVLTAMTEVMADLDKTISDLDGKMDYFEETLGVFNQTLARIDELAPRLNAVVDRMERIVERVERIVDIGEAAVAPLGATENAVRSLVKAIRDRAHL